MDNNKMDAVDLAAVASIEKQAVVFRKKLNQIASRWKLLWEKL